MKIGFTDNNDLVVLRVILAIITIYSISSCKVKSDYSDAANTSFKYRYAAVTACVADEMTLIFIPVRRSGDTGTEILCYDTCDLYRTLNIKVMDYNNFCEYIFERIVSSTAIELSEDAYEYFSDGIVHPVQKIDSLYTAGGIEEIVREMNSFPGTDVYENSFNRNCFYYMAYLCWQNDIIWSLDCATDKWTASRNGCFNNEKCQRTPEISPLFVDS